VAAIAGGDDELRRSLALAKQRAPVVLPSQLVEAVCALCVSVGAEGLRADLTICRAAAGLARWEGRPTATEEDVRRVAPLALAHRARHDPFDPHGLDEAELQSALDDAFGEGESDGGEAPERVAQPSAPAPITRLAPDRRVEGPRGRLVGDRPPGPGGVSALAVGATVRAAVARRAISEDVSEDVVTDTGPLVAPADLRQAVHKHQAANLIVIAVDASGSMGAERRMEAAKGAVLSLLIDSYQRRDRVALVTFRGDEATVALRPTGSVEIGRTRLTELPTGGRTPLAAGIRTALDVARSAGDQHHPLIVLITDGRATAAADSDPRDAANAAAVAVRRAGIPAVVVDVEEGPARLGLAAGLADAMGARHITLEELTSPRLTAAVRAALPVR
jgi:magnesium chelatase subunit D